MPVRFSFPAAVIVTSLLVVSCGGSSTPAEDHAPSAPPASAAPPAMMGTPQAPQTVPLTERDVEGFIAALSEFRSLGLDLESNVGSNPSSATGFVESLRTNARAQAIIQKQGMDASRFYQVAYSVMMAMAAAEIGDRSPEHKEAMEKLDQMKGKLPAEQFEAMRKGYEGAMASMQAIEKQPEGNVALVARYKDRIEKVAEK